MSAFVFTNSRGNDQNGDALTGRCNTCGELPTGCACSVNLDLPRPGGKPDADGLYWDER